MPTILRPVIIHAVESVFAQDYAGRIQLLIGVDKASGPKETLLEVLSRRPPNLSAMMLELPYSTSVRHGGLHNATDGGSLRAILSLAANTPYVAYLDDDNAWRPNHVRSLLAVMPGKAWAFSDMSLRLSVICRMVMWPCQQCFMESAKPASSTNSSATTSDFEGDCRDFSGAQRPVWFIQ